MEYFYRRNMEGFGMIEGIQIPPRYHRYHGGWWNVNQCTECKATGLYEDHHIVDTCKYCGGKVIRHGSGIWTTVYEPFSILGLFTLKLAKTSYWKIKEGS